MSIILAHQSFTLVGFLEDMWRKSAACILVMEKRFYSTNLNTYIAMLKADPNALKSL